MWTLFHLSGLGHNQLWPPHACLHAALNLASLHSGGAAIPSALLVSGLTLDSFCLIFFLHTFWAWWHFNPSTGEVEAGRSL